MKNILPEEPYLIPYPASANSKGTSSSLDIEHLEHFLAELNEMSGADEKHAASPDQPLQGYRLGLIFKNRHEERHFKEKGASVLRIYTAPYSEGRFKQWWLKQIDRARKDRVELVVVRQAGLSVQGQLLKNIEEAEFYCNDEGGPGRIRTTTFSSLRGAMSGAVLTLADSWGDTIEKGESRVVERLSGDEDDSCSDCESGYGSWLLEVSGYNL